MLNEIKNKIYSSESFREIPELLKSNDEVFIYGVNGSLCSFVADHLHKSSYKKILFITYDEDRSFKIKDDLDLLNGSGKISMYSPGHHTDLSLDENISKILIDISGSDEYIVVTDSKKIHNKIVSRDRFQSSIIELKKDTTYEFSGLIEKLQQFNFTKKDFVDEVGDFSVRGGIIDLFPESGDCPLRIEFFGDMIESIREFDINSQRSVKEITEIKIGMNLSVDNDDEILKLEKEETILDYLSTDTLVIIEEPELAGSELTDNEKEKLKENKKVYITGFSSASSEEGIKINFHSKPQPDFHSNLSKLYGNLTEYIDNDYEVFILASDDHQAKRIQELIEDFEDEELIEKDKEIHSLLEENKISINETQKKSLSGAFKVIPESLHNGFIFPDSKILLYTEHQIFGRYFKQIKKKKQKFRGITFSELKELQYGDYIVHRDFGVGKFAGLKKIKVGNNRQEVVKLEYKGNDTLFLNLNYINLIKKYSATEGHKPELTRLGGSEWDKVRQKAKKQVKDIARDLIILYAKRKSERGFSFSPDSHWQKELEANFMYEDTPDQYQSTTEVKEDMESEIPMDRLICGDVGFGKTEIAVRAAFKSVLDNKQVAVLVPTTILAVQHYNTFRDRLAPFAVEVQSITRLKSTKEQKEILKNLEEGKVNILIGTHRLLSKDIKFKDLGLLIIDEEQRFGVKAKEKLRSLQPNVDTLTLTATPIPRTLNFSLLGARDLSFIMTPPKNRKPIETELIKFNWNAITDIVRQEINKKGQVYFVNDKISSLYTLADTLKTYVPEAKIGIAHGQMDGKELEDVVINFIEKRLNVLLCTKIIESGLDIPNVNTIIINNADRYGLAELYQLRGRVGRSEEQAYAYLISPPNGKLTKNALRRLQAIEEFTELGSGFNLAMRDMEIRGVGNLLGKEQSGFVQQMGFDTYIEIIEEAVLELRENEFKDLFKNEASLKRLNESIKKKLDEKSTVIENDFDALIPKDYISNDTERLNIYRRLYELKKESELEEITKELRDRFGDFLDDVENLLNVIRLKIRATKTGIEKIAISGKHAIISLPENTDHDIFKSEFFNNYIEKLSSQPKKFFVGKNKDKPELEMYFRRDDDKARIEELERILI
jgi:transcription-repair coupling factor (superfamily II helicase)